MKFVKKPVEIEAILFTAGNRQEVYEFIGEKYPRENETIDEGEDPIIIHTLEGDMKAELGDYVIKGVNGEFYPCKPDIFQKTYDLVSEPSGLLKWAMNEVEIATKAERDYERQDAEERGETYDENGFSYGGACYESALKAFKSLCDDNHSGMSITFTKNALNRLIDGKPLRAIEDVEEEWDTAETYDSNCIVYQNKRMSSLFKYVYKDGTIKYQDVDREVGFIDGEDCGFGSYRVSNPVNVLFPIEMPYYPYNDIFKVIFKNDDDFYPYKIITPWLEVIEGDIRQMMIDKGWKEEERSK